MLFRLLWNTKCMNYLFKINKLYAYQTYFNTIPSFHEIILLHCMCCGQTLRYIRHTGRVLVFSQFYIYILVFSFIFFSSFFLNTFNHVQHFCGCVYLRQKYVFFFMRNKKHFGVWTCFVLAFLWTFLGTHLPRLDFIFKENVVCLEFCRMYFFSIKTIEMSINLICNSDKFVTEHCNTA